jgi:hypothetical protein
LYQKALCLTSTVNANFIIKKNGTELPTAIQSTTESLSTPDVPQTTDNFQNNTNNNIKIIPTQM